MALVFVFSCLMLTACGGGKTPDSQPEPNPSPASTITLAEAKVIILHALALDNAQTQGVQLMASTGNRDIMEKFGRFTFAQETNDFIYPSGEKIREDYAHGEFIYQDGVFVKYLWEDVNWTYYLEDGKVYGIRQDSDAGENLDSTDLGANLAVLSALFSEIAFDEVYEDVVTKTQTENGYCLTLNFDWRGYLTLACADMPEEEFEMMLANIEMIFATFPPEVCQGHLHLNFDQNDEIIDATFTATLPAANLDADNNITQRYTQTTLMQITRATGEIEQPQWVADYLAGQHA